MVSMPDFFKSDDDDKDKPPLPIPNVTARYGGDESPWTEEQVRGMMSNPIYAGVPPYPSIVPEETWVRAGAKMIRDDGAEQFLVNMLYMLQTSMYDVMEDK